MSEYLVKKESLTAIADEVRTLSGTTNNLSLADMSASVNEANTSVATQTDIIAQIATVLESKAVSAPITVSHDGNGNVTLTGVKMTNDMNGNIVLS